MYTVTPTPDKKRALSLVFALSAAGLVLFIPFPVGTVVSLTLRALGLWCFFGAFAVFDRYLCTTFSYTVSEAPDGAELTVVRRRYSKMQTVCRIYLSDIIRISDAKNVARGETKRGATYKYHSMMRKKGLFCALVSDGGEEAAIVFAPDAEMVTLIKSGMGKAKGQG